MKIYISITIEGDDVVDAPGISVMKTGDGGVYIVCSPEQKTDAVAPSEPAAVPAEPIVIPDAA